MYKRLNTKRHDNMYYKVCEACNAAVASKCIFSFIEKFQKTLEDAPVASDDNLKEIWKKEKKCTVREFRECRKMGSRNMIDEAEDSLCAEIKAEFKKLKLNYFTKKDQNISKASSMAVLQYETSMEKIVHSGAFVSEEVLEQNSQSAQTEALALFNLLLKLQKDDEVFIKERANISELLQDKFLEFETLNSTNKTKAEEAINTHVTNLSQLYAEKLDLKIGGRTLSEEKLEKYNNNISASLTAEFEETHAESPLLNNALGRLGAEFNEKLEKVRESFKSTFREHLAKAQELSSKSLAYCTNTMTETNANELDVKEFNTSHAVTNTAAVKILTAFQNTLPQEIMLESLTALQSNISDAYVNMLSSFNEKVAKAQADISAATKAAKKQYKERMKLTAGDHYVLTDSFLESQHNKAHTEALAIIEQAIQATQLTFKDEKKNKIFSDYSDVINKWFADIRDANSKKMGAAEKQIEEEVRNGINQYELEKDTSINEVDVTDIDVDDFLDPIVEKIETKFNDACHSNPMYSQGKQELVRLLKAEREKTKQEIEVAKELFHINSSAAVALALQNYEVKMGEIDANVNDSEFQDFHDQQLTHSIEILHKSEVLINSKWVEKYQEDLKLQINESFEKLFSDFKQKRIDFVKAIQEGKESAKGMYTQAIEIYFQESPEPFSEAQFQAQHNQEKKDARQHFLNCFQGQKSRLQNNNQEIETSVLIELGKEINSISDTFGKRNEARKLQVKTDLESEVIPHVEHAFTKSVRTALTSEADLVSAEQVNKCQPSVMNSLAEKVLSPFKSGSYAYELRLEFLERIVAEKLKELQHSHNDARVANNKNNELVDEAFSHYKNKMVDVLVSGCEKDNFESAHISASEEALDILRKSAPPSTTPAAATTSNHFLDKLKSQIHDFRKDMEEKSTEFASQISKAVEDAVGIYTQGQNTYIQSRRYVDEAEFTSKHHPLRDEAIRSLTNDLKKLTLYSKTVHLVESGGLAELEKRLSQLLAQIQDTNLANKEATEERMKASVKTIAEEYIVDMNLELQTGTSPTIEQVQEYHDQIYIKSMDKFARVNSKSPVFPKWNDVLQKNLQTKLHAYRQKISDAEDQTNRVGEALVLDGINYYRETMRESNKQDEDSFERTHLLIKKFSVDLLKNTGKNLNKDQLAVFVRKLEVQIQNEYEEFSSNISQNIIKIQGVIQSLKQQLIEQYGMSMRKTLSYQNGQTADAKLQALHNQEVSAAQTKLNQCYNGIQTSSRIFKDQQIPDVQNITKSIEALFQQLKKENSESITQSQTRLNNHIESSTKKYVEGMTLKLNGEFVLEKKLETLHTSVAKPLLENFTLVWSASFLFKNGHERLLNEINGQKTKFKNEMTAAHNAIHESLRLCVQNSIAKYKEEMNKILLEDDQVFSEGHQTHQKKATETLQKLRNSETEKYINKYESELQKEILETQVKLLGDHHRCKMQFGASLVQAKESSRKYYDSQMNLFFDSIKTYISPSLVEEHHIIKSAEAIIILQDQYKKHQGTRLQDQEENDFLELNENIQHNYEKFQGINNERLRHFQEEQRKNLGAIKENYKQSVKMLAESEKTEDDFVRKNGDVVESCENKLLAQLKSKHASKEFTSELAKDLKLYIEDQFKDYIAFFQSRMAQDRAAVTSALIESRQYYNAEMNKRVQTRDWFEPEELSKINTEVIDLSIGKCENVQLTPSQEEQLRDAMAVVYQKYSEDNTLKTPVENPAIGIDLGTTYSCVGVYINGEVKIIPNRDVSDGTTIPSYVSFNRDRTIDVGNSAKNMAFLNPQNTIFDAKRLIGRSYKDPIVQQDIKLWPFSVIDDHDKPKIQVFDKQFRPEEISAKVLIKIKMIAESYLNKKVHEAVVTVPAYFNDGQRQATRDAAEIAGLKVKILNEPTAAAIAYKLHRTDELKRNVLVFDLGGGTFDVAVLEIKGKDIVVKATGGDTHLGGEDFDNNIFNEILERVKTKFDIDLARGRDSSVNEEKSKASGILRRLRDRCEAAKRNLSDALATVIAMDSIQGDFTLEEKITREEFENLNMDLFKKCMDVVQKALDDAKLGKTDIDDIVLVGGSTRIPKVQELLKQFFDNQKELNGNINPDEAVARGAAIQAALLHAEQATSLRDSVALADVTPHSLGIEVVTGNMSVIIPKHSKVPCSHTEVFTTVKNNQTEVTFGIFEGEKTKAVENNNLGNFTLKKIPPALAGMQNLDCTMTIDDEGILHVKAVCTSNNVQNDITIETYNGRMTKEEIENAKTNQPFQY